MARIAIRRLKYFGDNFSYESPPLNDGINIIEGANGTGKSTFSDLLYYSLSGSPEMLNSKKESRHKEIISDSNNYVEVLIQIDSLFYTISRFIGSNDLTIRSESEGVNVYPVNRSPEKKQIFSDWILSKLGIEPVELSMGSDSWFLNIKDLMRLIYHNQAPNPKDVYKVSDSSGYVSDSKIIREAIFEVLLGQSFQDYYKLLSELRRTESERLRLKSVTELYAQMRAEIESDPVEINVSFLKESLIQKEEQLRRLEVHLDSLNIHVVAPVASLNRLKVLKAKFASLEMTILEYKKKRNDALDEMIKFRQVKVDLMIEVTQIKKMIYTHEKLALFSADTCPYCLREVERIEGKCVCGADIDETQYERFFYSVEEYLDVLKSKQKAVDTVNTAISSVENEILVFENSIMDCETNLEKVKSHLSGILSNVDRSFDVSAVRETNEAISKLKNEIRNLRQSVSFEAKRQDVENKYSDADTLYKTLTKRVQQAKANADVEMDNRIADFNKIYSKLMHESVIDCRRAYLSRAYMPVINDGEYRESSANVPKRLMYYLTILRLSLQSEEISFPRFLLIDTPETSGIDRENLIKSLSMIDEVISGVPESKFQIILSTGIGKYPSNYKERVVQTLTEQGRLLIPKKDLAGNV